MAFQPGFKARILLGDFSLSAKLSDISVPLGVEMLDPTTFGDNGVKRALPGLDSSSFSCEGFIDADTNTEVASWTSTTPFTYAQNGLALGSPVILLDTLKASYEPGTQVGGVAAFSLGGQTDGVTSFGVSLHDLTAETVDGNGTGHDGGAATSNGGIAQIHVTAFSGLTSAVVTVADSADNVSFATIATFATVTGTTSERKAVSGTVRRYLRYSLDVTGIGSVTFQVSFARH